MDTLDRLEAFFAPHTASEKWYLFPMSAQPVLWESLYE